MKEKAKKRLSVFALCACVALGSIGVSIADYSAETVSADTTADGAFMTNGSGDGSADKPYLIDTAQELYYISTKTNSFKDKYIKMTADIDLSEYGASFNSSDGWPGIAYFGGHFDGDGHSIKNLYTTKTGLFVSLTQGTDPSVSNLVMENVTVLSASSNTGIIVGQLKNGKVENCTVKNTCSVTGAQAVGGIVGQLDGGSILGCTNYANVVSESTNGCVGGIVGTVVSNTNNRTITVEKCVNRGNVSAAVKNVGGIVGQFNALKATCTFMLRECVNYGAVNGGSSTGGVIGISQSENTYNATVKDCYNVGLVTGAPAAGNYIGGFVGNSKYCKFENCYTRGAVRSNAKGSAGGFVGKQDAGIQMTNCFYDNEVTATVEGFDYAPTSYCAKTAISPTLSNVPSDGYTAAAMKSASSYTGFGSTIWTIKDGEYPALAFESAGASEEPAAAKIDKVSLTLEGNIGLNFYTTFKKADVQSVTYTLNGTETTLAETTWKEKTESNAEYLIFSCPVPAKNYLDQVALTITDKYNKVTEGNYSVKDYADYIEEHKDDYATEYPLISAMVDYCEQARKYFAAEAVSEDFSAEYDQPTFTSYQATAEGTLAEGIEITQTSLVLDSETTIKIYLTSTVEFNVTGGKVVDLGNNRYCIRIENISAKDLDKAFTIVINDTYTITYSAFSYAYSAYGIESLALTNVMEAMYAYNQAANEYFGA